eukprot:CAMPEP_0119406772 /NCGR_PEP_ID=MMETSP1335-20130426/971_1 /TAXON_ID=259385 /ORGANISM="Chrysoculter rhomboideus, Strain RCC1486" /LENGTH=177 /DNA_ID=CAMNT_0007430863 /DNA_START=33 /DNA_END=567 /DNA_ORIENTATION=-
MTLPRTSALPLRIIALASACAAFSPAATRVPHKHRHHTVVKPPRWLSPSHLLGHGQLAALAVLLALKGDIDVVKVLDAAHFTPTAIEREMHAIEIVGAGTLRVAELADRVATIGALDGQLWLSDVTWPDPSRDWLAGAQVTPHGAGRAYPVALPSLGDAGARLELTKIRHRDLSYCY